MNRRRSYVIYLLTIGFALSVICSCSDPLNRSITLSPLANDNPTAALSYLQEYYNGSPCEIREDVVFAGYVTANDLSGNLYKTFIVQDESGAVEIRAGLYDLYNIFPLGQRVIIRARGTWIGSYNGVIQLGRVSYEHSGWRLEEFGVRSLLDKYIFRGEGSNKLIEPRKRKLSQISDTDCGLLVETERVFLKPDTTSNISTWEGLHTFYNRTGDSIAVYTSSYADFAAQQIPTDSINLTGILTKGKYDGAKEQYTIKL